MYHGEVYHFSKIQSNFHHVQNIFSIETSVSINQELQDIYNTKTNNFQISLTQTKNEYQIRSQRFSNLIFTTLDNQTNQ